MNIWAGRGRRPDLRAEERARAGQGQPQGAAGDVRGVRAHVGEPAGQLTRSFNLEGDPPPYKNYM